MMGGDDSRNRSRGRSLRCHRRGSPDKLTGASIGWDHRMWPKRGGWAVVAGMIGALWLTVGMALAASSPRPITHAAVWHAPANFTTRVHERCGGQPQPAFGQCFLATMAAAGASPAAIDFTRRMGDEVYLAALADMQPVAAALVF